MKQKRDVAEALASNPTMPLAVVLGAAAVGTALLSKSAHEGAKDLWNAAKSKIPDLPSLGGGGGGAPAPAPELPPLSPSTSPFSPSPTIVNITNPTPIVQTTPSIFPKPTRAPTRPGDNFLRGLERIGDAFRNGEVLNIPGTRLPIPTSIDTTVGLGLGIGRYAARAPRDLARIGGAVVGTGYGIVSGFAGGSFGGTEYGRSVVRRATDKAGDFLSYNVADAAKDTKRLYDYSAQSIRSFVPSTPRAGAIPTQTGTQTRSQRSGGSGGGTFGGAGGYRGGSPGTRFRGGFVPIKNTAPKTTRRR